MYAANRHKSVESDELFEAFNNTLSEQQYDLGQNVTVTGFMKQWTQQAGYPMIDVARINDSFVITQVRTQDFDLNRKKKSISRIPVVVVYITGTNVVVCRKGS